ncbi:CaiB/BaiF CoA transferase family protein [Brevibacillus reuszeri]|uniref:Acyl-CoA transferase n=1 Tax=Brevibacillus reuszeri TaxID=54915 RepID=A0A0K9YV88_9BACL|nr:CaiB/BaiF CoA-transferase family protein [Brevibacillus reuszeri]KNB72572.1 acyl-CoA transferase [Brevibacillus reuszeri]MED1860743.1 CaiB/BaiF CoA-transferase family protein [Brevibacillus reuszeri]
MLTGVTVVDFSRHLPGPICTMRLADLGAEVIEVDTFLDYDHGRSVDTTNGDPTGQGGFFLRSHRKHKSISLNLRTDEGKALAFALARQADVVVESFRPGVLRHLGLDYDSLWAVHPAVIYCSVTGYGQSGELFQLGQHDLNVQAVSGFLSTIRDAAGIPVITEAPITDYALGLYASEQICAALVQRLRTGRGAYLDVASADLFSSWMGLHAIFSTYSDKMWKRSSRQGRLAYQVFETSDGHYVALAALEEKFWLNFCRAVGRGDWEQYHLGTISQLPEMNEEMKALFLSRTQAEWSELGSEVDCCLTAVEELERWGDSPYVTSREIAYTLPFVEQTEGALERKKPALVDGERKAPPWLADHTHDLLKRKLNLTDTKLRRLVKLGVIPPATSKTGRLSVE